MADWGEHPDDVECSTCLVVFMPCLKRPALEWNYGEVHATVEGLAQEGLEEAEGSSAIRFHLGRNAKELEAGMD